MWARRPKRASLAAAPTSPMDRETERDSGRTPTSAGPLPRPGPGQTARRPPAPRQWRPEIPAPLEQAILRALAKDPAARFVSTAAFAAALHSALAPDPDLHDAPTAAQPVMRAPRRPTARLAGVGPGEPLLR